MPCSISSETQGGQTPSSVDAMIDSQRSRLGHRARFSVVTICRNDRAGLERTEASISMQTFRDFEWVVVDGASTDDTLMFLSSVESPSISWVSEPDSGLYDAMNKGLERAAGEYIVFMNSGDSFARPDVLQTIDDAVNRGMCDLIYGDGIEVTEEGAENYKPAFSHKRVWYSMFTHHQAMFYRTDFLDSQRYDTSFEIAADWAFTAQTLRAGAKGCYVPIAVCKFFRGGISTDPSFKAKSDREHLRIHREILKSPGPLTLAAVGLKRAANFFHNHLPGAYEYLRMRRGD